ncbi:thiolase family protein [Acinetobacter rudis]|uniref:Beta-ketoadipyl-CoA thiolase n=1 Tax=Acinetobacter rudis TaxID=632955 RepID=A0AAW8JCQ2_9GAMM|nr:thiolase family protein [Acinetobacter rudis]MDQ8936370.1 thiolase family protein [Acinetobacter rudis]MDQ8953407.1 thiolase family protein [Acinetobacter rudis]MDQ9018631.1 thiolase family protein [Acinetobacter rudis]
MKAVYIVDGARTAMGGFQGSLSGLSAPALSAVTIQAAVQRSGLQPKDIQEVILGCVLPAGLKQGPARQAMRLANIPDEVGATTINKICGSGMKAVMQASDAIRAESIDIAIAGGMESMSNSPYLLEKARSGYRMGHGEIKDHMFMDGLEDAETRRSMGTFAQGTANDKGYTREDMDQFAIRSLKRAQHAVEQGFFKDEIIAVEVKSRKGTVLVDQDEQPFNANIDKIPLLKPAFAQDGTVTAANSSSISDGASAFVIASEDVVKSKKLKPLAKIIAYSTHSQHPSEFTLAPVGAIKKVLDKAAWSVSDVDLWEINEAFAMVTMLAIDAFHLDPETVNIHGGACALGHPLGSSGSRIILTLIHALKRTNKKRGVASLCIGGGEATAIAIELCE